MLSCKTTHIGSLPLENPERAIELVLEYVDIPAWPQLPKFKNESMNIQFNEGLPGFIKEKEVIDTSSLLFEEEFLKFYEIYLQIIEENKLEYLKSFSLSEEYARGFNLFLKKIQETNKFEIVKGQITGPFTLSSSLKTQTGENLIFKDNLRDLIVKFLTLKSLSQALELKKYANQVILFLDEPGLAGFGSTAFISISKDIVLSMLNEIINTLNKFEIITGIHVCANTSWDIVLESQVNILSFDSFNFYDKLIIYKENLRNFIKQENKYLAWGLIPTQKEILESVNFEEIWQRFENQLKNMSSLLGVSEDEILHKSLFTPSCGLGSLDEPLAVKAFKLLKDFKTQVIRR